MASNSYSRQIDAALAQPRPSTVAAPPTRRPPAGRPTGLLAPSGLASSGPRPRQSRGQFCSRRQPVQSTPGGLPACPPAHRAFAIERTSRHHQPARRIASQRGTRTRPNRPEPLFPAHADLIGVLPPWTCKHKGTGRRRLHSSHGQPSLPLHWRAARVSGARPLPVPWQGPPKAIGADRIARRTPHHTLNLARAWCGSPSFSPATDRLRSRPSQFLAAATAGAGPGHGSGVHRRLRSASTRAIGRRPGHRWTCTRLVFARSAPASQVCIGPLTARSAAIVGLPSRRERPMAAQITARAASTELYRTLQYSASHVDAKRCRIPPAASTPPIS
ncbi:hypothetical protein ACCO45_001899 [Purpureocillium lilacinum]|uniref:Uncharacterized protein n=1 Tax=Purpureocillium lilacinum TaxID=33203 RepID=A0ACC4EB04_PURLI